MNLNIQVVWRSIPLLINLIALVISVKLLAVNFDVQAMSQVTIILTFTSLFSSVVSNPLSQTAHRFGAATIYSNLNSLFSFPFINIYVLTLGVALHMSAIEIDILLMGILVPSTIVQSIMIGDALNSDNLKRLWMFQILPPSFRLMSIGIAVFNDFNIQKLLITWFSFEIIFTYLSFMYIFVRYKKNKLSKNNKDKMPHANKYLVYSAIYSMTITAVLISDRFVYGFFVSELAAFLYIKYQIITMPFLILGQLYTQAYSNIFFNTADMQSRKLSIVDMWRNSSLLKGFILFTAPAIVGVFLIKIWFIEIIQLVSSEEYTIIANYTDFSLFTGLLFFLCQPLLVINQSNLVISKSIFSFLLGLSTFILVFFFSNNFHEKLTVHAGLISHDHAIFLMMSLTLLILLEFDLGTITKQITRIRSLDPKIGKRRDE